MKTTFKIVLIIIGALFLLAIYWLAGIYTVFIRVPHYVPEPVYSYNGSRVIVPTINYDKADPWGYLCVNLEIRDTTSGKTLYQIQTHASDRMKWSVYWIGENEFRLDSSDIGSYCWKEELETWQETACP